MVCPNSTILGDGLRKSRRRSYLEIDVRRADRLECQKTKVFSGIGGNGEGALDFGIATLVRLNRLPHRDREDREVHHANLRIGLR